MWEGERETEPLVVATTAVRPLGEGRGWELHRRNTHGLSAITFLPHATNFLAPTKAWVTPLNEGESNELWLQVIAEDSDWQVGFSLFQVLPGWVRFAPTAFINVSMNTIFMHWIGKANSQLIMQNNPEVFHASPISQELNFPSPFGLWWTWPFTSSKELWAARLKLVMRASFAFQAVREPFLNTLR